VKHFFVVLFLSLCCACASAINNTLLYEEQTVTKDFDDYATLFVKDKKQWEIIKDHNSVLLKNKQKGNITTLLMKSIRLSGNLTNKNFAESLLIAQAFNGAEIESFSKTKLKNGKTSITKITQDDFTIVLTTISKNDVAYVFICMGTESKLTENDCNEILNLVHIK
jgi:hypothetical protein